MIFPPLCCSLGGCLKSSGDLPMAYAHCSRQDGRSQSSRDPLMAYSIYLDQHMECRHDILRAKDSGVPVTLSHRAIAQLDLAYCWSLGGDSYHRGIPQ